MGRILALSLDHATTSALRQGAASVNDVLEELDFAAALALLESDRADVEVIIVGAAAEEPVRTAQRLFAVAPQIPVLVLVEHDRYRDICKAFAFAPFVGNHLRCIDAEEGPQFVLEALKDAVMRLRKTTAYRGTIAALNARLAAASAPVPPPAMLGGILDNAPIGVIVTDTDRRVCAWNRKAGEILGRSERDALGLEFSTLLRQDERDKWDAGLGPVLRRERSAFRETFTCDSGNEVRQVEITAARLAGGGDNTLLLLQDVSDRVRLLEDLQEAVRVRDEFLSVASHELKTPLTSVQLLVGSLAHSAERLAPAKIKTRAISIERSVAKLGSLVDNLLDVARIQQRQLDVECEEFDLVATVNEVVDRHKIDCERAGCTIQVTGPDSAIGTWDPVRIEQVITNLLSNALKYGAGKSIEVCVEANDEFATLRIRDHGIGIPLELQKRIFERFERGVSSRNYGGLGLGLWITHRIVEAHGGAIELVSAPGRGASFEIRLPRCSPPTSTDNQRRQ